MNLLISWILNAAIILGVAHLLPGFHVASFGSALMAALVLGVLGTLLGPLLEILGTVLALPVVLLTFGLFFLVIRVIVNMMLLRLTTDLVSGFSVQGTGALFLGVLLISILQHIIALVLRKPA